MVASGWLVVAAACFVPAVVVVALVSVVAVYFAELDAVCSVEPPCAFVDTDAVVVDGCCVVVAV